jgi:flagellar protein FlaJ
MKEKVIKWFYSLFDNSGLTELEKETLKRIKKDTEIIAEKKEKKPSLYVGISNRLFSDFSTRLMGGDLFKGLPKDLVKANLDFLPKTYVSIIISTTLLSVIVAVLLFIFFLFFNIGVKLPIITIATDTIFARILKTFWILLFIPISTFLFMYLYPSMEKDAARRKINQELPFVTIHMSAIAGSLIDPTKIFSIIVSTKEYPYIEKEFVKLMNSMNILGHDLVSALRGSALNTSSKRLAELFNGMATTINSGGDLPRFFEERASTLLFEYNLEKEKNTKLAETFMDIYISVVIAAPMILMLLLMMMRISGLGVPFSTGAITLMMITGVSFINLIFLTFLHIKQPAV